MNLHTNGLETVLFALSCCRGLTSLKINNNQIHSAAALVHFLDQRPGLAELWCAWNAIGDGLVHGLARRSGLQSVDLTQNTLTAQVTPAMACMLRRNADGLKASSVIFVKCCTVVVSES